MQFKTKVEPKEHDAFVSNHPLCNLLQSSQWAKVKENWDHEIVGVVEKDALIVSASILIKRLPLGFTMMYIPRGPIMDYENKDVMAFFFKELKKWAKKYRCLFIKMDPGIHVNDYKIDEQNTNRYPITNTILSNMKLSGAIHQGFSTYIEESIQPRFQANVYKTEDFDEQLPRHTKRLIKDALKRDVKVIKADASRMKEFSDVVSLTEERKNVNLRNHEYFMQLMDIYGDDAYLFLASVNIPETLERLLKEQEANALELEALKEGSPKKQRRLNDIKNALEKDIKEFREFEKDYPQNSVIAGILSVVYGNTMEMLYAGMNDRFKKFMPQYYLYTENMKYAFEHGLQYANMGGVEGDLADGLTKFKSNFNPYINEFIGEFDVPVSVFYRLARMAMKLRKKIR
ncbi:MAG: peptidoglycan bridge formation glycyltransferase FemA/FemB family protein [Longicatena sp.]